jgi:hypothetical protein
LPFFCTNLLFSGHSELANRTGPGAILCFLNQWQPKVLRQTTDKLTMRPDGGLTGPGLIDVEGRIIVGYLTHTNIMKTVAAGTTSTPDYRPAMARCVIGSLAMPPSPSPLLPLHSCQ